MVYGYSFHVLFELIEAVHRVHRFSAVLLSMPQQKLDKLCREYKILRPRLTAIGRDVSPASPVA